MFDAKFYMFQLLLYQVVDSYLSSDFIFLLHTFVLSSDIHGLTAMAANRNGISEDFSHLHKNHLLFYSLDMSRPSNGQHIVYFSSELLYCLLRAEAPWYIYVYV